MQASSRPGRWTQGVGALGCLFLLVITPAASAEFLQSGVDAAYTGVTDESGPKRHEVAFVAFLPGARAPQAPPILVDGAAYVAIMAGLGLVSPPDDRPPQHDTTAIMRVDLATGEVTTIAKLDSPPLALASDGRRLFVTYVGGVMAYTLPDGAPAWSAPWQAPPMGSERTEANCANMVVTEDAVFAACADIAETIAPFPDKMFWAAKLNRTTGEQDWSVPLDEPTPGQPVATVPNSHRGRSGVVRSMTLLGDYLHIAAATGSYGYVCGDEILVLRASDGAFHWAWGPFPPTQESLAFITDPPGTGCPNLPLIAPPTGEGPVGYYKQQSLYEVNAATKAVNWELNLQGRDAEAGDAGGGLAFNGETLWATSYSAVHRIPVNDRAIARSSTALPPGQSFSQHGLLLADGVIYARAAADSKLPARGYVNAYDAETLDLLWTHELVDEVYLRGNLYRYRFAVDDGLLVVAGYDGSLTVLGRTPASIRPHIEPSSTYPGVGAEVRVDLSASGPGKDGPATGFRAEWGDGTFTAWQADPVLRHVYSSGGDHIATFHFRNDAGQLSSVSTTFHVGASAPTFLEAAFSRENQDLTFGLIGVALFLGGGLVALARARRRHRRVQRELAAIDAAAQPVQTYAARLAAAMQERRSHCRGLLVDGKIDEFQYTVLEKHIDDVSRGAKAHQMRELFDFLPHGMVAMLQDMIADGRITSWERQSFHVLLRENDVLTVPQKRKVAALVDKWFELDKAG